jgi:peptidoglycan/xylan/chitin deacetylase (PgdA/CDA1 family)
MLGATQNSKPGLGAVLTANRAPIPILTYHQIAVAPAKPAPYRSLYVSPNAFARQMAFLSFLGYKGLSMTALLPYLRGELEGKVVGITLDDGYVNNLHDALPALTKHGFTATCYAVSQLVGQTNAWDAAKGIAPSPLMNADQLRAWVLAGMELGAHTRNHVNLRQVDEATAKSEIALGKQDLEELVQQPITQFCYPYGEFEPMHAQWVKNAGFDSATTTQRGRCQPAANYLALPRVPVLKSTTLVTLWLKLATDYEDKRRA